MAKTTKTPGAPDTMEQPSQAIDWSQDAGAGMEHVTQTDLGIPFLGIIQLLSPQHNKMNPKFKDKGIPDCKPGDIFDTLSNTVLWTEGQATLKFIPCGFQKLFVEWKTRESGGGFVRVHRDESILLECRKDERNRDFLRNGNIVSTTAYFYGFLMNGEIKQYVLGMTSTQLATSRRWLNMITALKMQGPEGKYTPPMFSHFYNLTTVLQTKDQNSWYGWKVEMGGMMTDPNLIASARDLSKIVASGKRLALPVPQEDAESDKI